MDIYERNIDDIITVELSEVNTDNILNIFLNMPNRTIYVTDNGKVEGIITFGDYKRNCSNGRMLFSKKYTAVNNGNEKDAFTILEQKEKIHSVPVLNEHNYIVKEYYKESRREDGSFLGMIDSICRYAIVIKKEYEKVIILTGALRQNEKVAISKLQQKYIDKILICEGIGFEELQSYSSNKIFVYDYDQEMYWYRKGFYDECKIECLLIDGWREDGITLKDRVNHVFELSALYKKIAIVDIDNDVWMIEKRPDNVVCVLSAKDIVFDKKRKIYVYKRKIENFQNLEAVFIPMCPLESAVIDVGNRMLPIISDWYIKVNLYAIRSDWDIVFNIIPQLEENGIKVLAIGNPDYEMESLDGDIEDLLKGRVNTNDMFEYIYKDVEYRKKLSEEYRDLVYGYRKGYIQRYDKKGRYYNCILGERFTCGNPKEYEHIIYLFGCCIVFGTYVEDRYTIGSCLRKRIENNYMIKNMGNEATGTNYTMRNTIFQTGDRAIVFLYSREVCDYLNKKKMLHSILDAYKKVYRLEEYVADSLVHCGNVIMENIAHMLYCICNSEHMFDESSRIDEQNDIVDFRYFKKETIIIPGGLRKWLDKVKINRVGGGTAGAIVMNCNPFTKGHRYLIEESIKLVDILYIFLVEENKSYFDFKDRLNMIKIGTADLENVIVIPSGNYIISSVTLPGYFSKEDKPDIKFDATEDLEIFAEIIAKEFAIRVRFAGEEPIDEFTNCYNEYMRQILPKYGIEFYEIPRMQCDGKVISASRVRRHIEDGTFEKIRELVMPEVYDYLQKICIN